MGEFYQQETASVNRWISCKDRMPDDGSYVLAWNTDLGYYVYAWYHKSCNVWRDNCNDDIEYDVDNISHWIPVVLKPPESEVHDDDEC